MKNQFYLKCLLLGLVLLFIPIANAENRLVYYEPIIVKLSGVIDVKDSPGPPNYESVENGDAAETGYYLKLPQSIDVVTPNVKSGTDECDEPEKNIHVVQLVIRHDSDWPKIRKGNHVTLTGTLFHAISGHHHTRVLMFVDEALKT